MPSYKGNSGNLMQHWTLCELIEIADEQNVPGLSFIDAHAMAPIAHTPDGLDTRFKRARVRLPGQQSAYERSWGSMETHGGYPNSAALVNRVWSRDFSMLLCEIDRSTIRALDAWLPGVRHQPRCKRAKVFAGNWRVRFGKGLPSPLDVGLPNGSVTLISFDPYMYYPHGANADDGNLYPEDLETTCTALEGVNGGVIIQLSTYRRGWENEAPQDVVINNVNQILGGAGFAPAVEVRLNGNMMSLVYSRDVPPQLEQRLGDMPGCFAHWRDRI